MAAFSSLLAPSNLFVGLKRAGSSNSCKDLDPAIPFFSSSSSKLGFPLKEKRRRMQMTEAMMTASFDPVSSLDLLPFQQRSQSAAAVAFDYRRMEEEEEEETRRMKDSVTAEKLDEWIRNSIGEIVRNIGEAPFLVQIFSKGTSMVRLEREEVSSSSSLSWPLMQKRWERDNSVPDGVILVEELDNERKNDGGEAAADETTNYSDSQSEGGSSSSRRTWGLVVQGRGMDCAASCYILNTCRVRSAGGFCTHFCLVRAKCFGETVAKQLTKAWLQGR